MHGTIPQQTCTEITMRNFQEGSSLAFSLLYDKNKHKTAEKRSTHLTIIGPICDMIKGNESLVENFYFLTPLSYHFKMLHFDANPITIGYLVTLLKTI